MRDIEFIVTKNIVTFTKDFLTEHLGERNWDDEFLLSFDSNLGSRDEVCFRLRGRNEQVADAWDYFTMVRHRSFIIEK